MNLVESVVSRITGSGINASINEMTKLTIKEKDFWYALYDEADGDTEVALSNIDHNFSMADWNKIEKSLTKKGYIKTYKMSGKIWIELMKDER